MTPSICCKLFSLIIVLSITSGCSTGYAPVSDIGSYREINKNTSATRNRTRAKSVPLSYKVRSGDTLYSIAWKYGLDFKKLARQNSISNRYLIYSGQVLSIKPREESKKVSANKDVVLNENTKESLIRNSIESSNKNIVAKSGKNITKKATIKKAKTVSSSVSKKHQKSAQKLRWSWPAKGQRLNNFNSENKGLNLKGNSGDTVRAAASGTVVYAGNGIIGYGNLIIIKHSQEYLSAYAHNSVILIKEDMKIKGGEKIAEIGSTGTTKTMLHFEIRKDGKPDNPLKY